MELKACICHKLFILEAFFFKFPKPLNCLVSSCRFRASIFLPVCIHSFHLWSTNSLRNSWNIRRGEELEIGAENGERRRRKEERRKMRGSEGRSTEGEADAHALDACVPIIILMRFTKRGAAFLHRELFPTTERRKRKKRKAGDFFFFYKHTVVESVYCTWAPNAATQCFTSMHLWFHPPPPPPPFPLHFTPPLSFPLLRGHPADPTPFHFPLLPRWQMADS